MTVSFGVFGWRDPVEASGVSMAYQETAAEQMDRYRVLPSFAHDFRDKPSDEQHEIFASFGIKHQIHKKMFEFLCVIVQDALARTGRALTTYKYYSDGVLKWASNPNNLRIMPGFPRSEETLKNNFDPLLEILIEKGICIVSPDLKAPDDKKTISFALEGQIKSNSDNEELVLVTGLLENEYRRIRSGGLLALPSRRQVENTIKHQLSERIRVVDFPVTQFNRQELAATKYAQAELIQFDFGNQYQVLATPRVLVDLQEIVIRQSVLALEALAADKVLGDCLKELLPGNPGLGIPALLAEKSGAHPAFEKRLAVWTGLLQKTMEVNREREGTTPAGKIKHYALYLLLTYLLFELKVERETGAEQVLIKDLYAHLSAYKRYMTKNELYMREKSQAFIKEHSEKEFDGLFARFVQSYSLLQNGDKTETLMHLKGPLLGECFIQSGYGLDLFREIPTKIRKPLQEILERHYILPLANSLYRGDGNRELAAMIASDETIGESLKLLIEAKYRQNSDLVLFLELHAFFESNPDVLAQLCRKFYLHEAQFFLVAPTGERFLKSVPQLLGCTRQDLQQAAERHVPVLRKLLHALQRLFGKRGGVPSKQAAGKKTGHAGQVRPETPAGKNGTKPASGTAARPAAQTIPKHLRVLTPEEQLRLLAQGKSLAEYLALWNRQIGSAAEENKRVVDGLIQDKLTEIKRKLKSGSRALELGLQASYILQNPRIDGIQNKEALFRYVSLYLFSQLEDFRKANRLVIEYCAKKQS